jgi:hypothetical protein
MLLPRTSVNKGMKKKAPDSPTRPGPGKNRIRWSSLDALHRLLVQESRCSGVMVRG